MTNRKAEWLGFLSDKRVGEAHDTSYDNFRSSYQRDRDAIVFSESFRKLQGKTQVFSLARNDYVRDRLTHSMEVASVGRNLGEIVGRHVIETHGIDSITAHDFGVILEAACLAHDIGHPPLAHAGEEAIREYFVNNADKLSHKVGTAYQDFLNFEGNAHNMRILCDLEQNSRQGGMRLTSAVLGAITKYPRLSFHHRDMNTKWVSKKFNFFYKDFSTLKTLADNLGLKPTHNDNEFFRSPLAYLVEAADDTCYALIDIEDAYVMGVIGFGSAVQLLAPMTDSKIERGDLDEIDYLKRLRAKAIGRLLDEVSHIFIENEDAILDGTFKGDLLDHVSVSREFYRLKEYAHKHIYTSTPAIEVRTAGYKIIDSLQDIFVTSAIDHLENGAGKSSKSNTYLNYIDKKYRKNILSSKDHYSIIMSVCDYVASMTDHQAVEVYKNFFGASIPSIR